VPAGAHDGARVRVPELGHAGSGGGAPGDLYVTLHVAPDPRFRWEGDDLHVVLPVAVHEAALGAKVMVPTLDGPVPLRVPPGTRAGQRLDARGNVHGHPGHRAPFETSSSPDSISDHPVAGMIQVPDPGPTWPARMPSSRAMGGAGSCDRSNARMRSIPGKRPEPGGRHVPPDRFVDGHTGGSRCLTALIRSPGSPAGEAPAEW